MGFAKSLDFGTKSIPCWKMSVLFVLSCFVSGCFLDYFLPEREVVLRPGMEISFQDDETGIKGHVICSRPSRRTVVVNDLRRIVSVEKRKDRWFGSFGVVTKGSLIDIFCPGRRIVYEEGLQHFCSQEEALEWLRQKRLWSYVFLNREGLMVSIEKGGGREKDWRFGKLALAEKCQQISRRPLVA